MDTQVLIAGAGPTGLVLALCLKKLGVRIRIIDKTNAPGTTSRALVVHGRTLEFYRQLGIAHLAEKNSTRFTSVNLWVGGRHVARVALGNIGTGLSPYPYMLIYPQDQHEQMLIEVLAQFGVKVERETELVSFDHLQTGIRARIKDSRGVITICEAEYLAGCDGAHSTVRKQLGAGFKGGTYTDLFYVADVAGDGPPVNGELHVALDAADLLAIFPLKEAGNVRLVGSIGKQSSDKEELHYDDVRKRVIEWLRLKVNDVRWFSTYRVHHRIAASFRFGRAFLLGDAAHIHSPVGGQGMNTGIGDAVNLAWKLAAVLENRADPMILDTYETERIAFAKRLVNTTDRVFQFASARGSIARFIRLHVVPLLLPRIFALNRMKRFMYMTVSQIAITYYRSALSVGRAGRIKAGDRLPWVNLSSTSEQVSDNFAMLESMKWQVHCYGDVSDAIKELCKKRKLPLNIFNWIPLMKQAGFKKNAIYLIRPDGYVGFADSSANPLLLERYLKLTGILV